MRSGRVNKNPADAEYIFQLLTNIFVENKSKYGAYSNL